MATAYLFLNYNCIWTYCFFLYLTQMHYVVFTVQISHYGKFTVLHKLISTVLQLTNQIK